MILDDTSPPQGPILPWPKLGRLALHAEIVPGSTLGKGIDACGAEAPCMRGFTQSIQSPLPCFQAPFKKPADWHALMICLQGPAASAELNVKVTAKADEMMMDRMLVRMRSRVILNSFQGSEWLKSEQIGRSAMLYNKLRAIKHARSVPKLDKKLETALVTLFQQAMR